MTIQNKAVSVPCVHCKLTETCDIRTKKEGEAGERGYTSFNFNCGERIERWRQFMDETFHRAIQLVILVIATVFTTWLLTVAVLAGHGTLSAQQAPHQNQSILRDLVTSDAVQSSKVQDHERRLGILEKKQDDTDSRVNGIMYGGAMVAAFIGGLAGMSSLGIFRRKP